MSKSSEGMDNGLYLCRKVFFFFLYLCFAGFFPSYIASLCYVFQAVSFLFIERTIKQNGVLAL